MVLNLLLKYITKKVDRENIIRDLLVGWAKEGQPVKALMVATMLKHEAREAEKDINKLLKQKGGSK